MIGVLTLVMACAFMGIWVRSLAIEEIIHDVTHSRRGMEPIYSRNGAIEHVFIPSHEELATSPVEELPVDSHPSEHIRGSQLRKEFVVWRLPYWSIVSPLTLISAFLLLTKPRIAKPKTIVENGISE